ncbi:MAG TPA: type I-E CRISPR-associated protein Cse2/CasB [Alphaproteobacteria bacterium]|nr:type I-E CRISPR-associated protein Cse2/CasB [Alphaproteobacteria bacterium]
MNTTTQPDTAPKDVGAICHKWWRTYLNKDTGGGRAARAKLRRASTPVEALAIAEVHGLYAALDRNIAPDRLSLIATALAQLEADDKTAARRFGGKGGGDNRVLSEPRFQNLVRATDPAALIVPLRRALTIIDKRADIRRLAGDLYYWSEKVRTRWCFDYYGASAAGPEFAKEEESET